MEAGTKIAQSCGLDRRMRLRKLLGQSGWHWGEIGERVHQQICPEMAVALGGLLWTYEESMFHKGKESVKGHVPRLGIGDMGR